MTSVSAKYINWYKNKRYLGCPHAIDCHTKTIMREYQTRQTTSAQAETSNSNMTQCSGKRQESEVEVQEGLVTPATWQNQR